MINKILDFKVISYLAVGAAFFSTYKILFAVLSAVKSTSLIIKRQRVNFYLKVPAPHLPQSLQALPGRSVSH